MELHDLKPAEGSKKTKRRKGRGIGSGKGKTAGKGHKGQKARSGKPLRPTFEGGQTPYFKRFPKRGFSNHDFQTKYAIVNVKDLNRFDAGSEIGAEELKVANLITDFKDGLKVLGDGEIEIELTVKANKFSQSAVEKIEAAGGKAEVI